MTFSKLLLSLLQVGILLATGRVEILPKVSADPVTLLSKVGDEAPYAQPCGGN